MDTHDIQHPNSHLTASPSVFRSPVRGKWWTYDIRVITWPLLHLDFVIQCLPRPCLQISRHSQAKATVWSRYSHNRDSWRFVPDCHITPSRVELTCLTHPRHRWVSKDKKDKLMIEVHIVINKTTSPDVVSKDARLVHSRPGTEATKSQVLWTLGSHQHRPRRLAFSLDAL